MASVVHELLTASLQKSSVPTYRRAWKLYEEFQLSIYNNSYISLPIMPATLALFVAYLFDNKYASSTVNTYVSALGFYPRQLKACPVQAFLDYVNVRGKLNGPLFINQDGSPVLRSDFSKMLCSIIQLCNLDPNRYKGHSFRIGTATYAAEQGISDTTIRHIG